MAETAAPALGLPELRYGDERDRLDALHHQLSNPVAPSDFEVEVGIGVQEDYFQLTTVSAVDQTGRVDQRYAVAVGEAAAGQDEPGETLGQRDGDARRDRRAPSPGWNCRSAPRVKVYPRVAGLGTARKRQVRIEPGYLDVEHAHTLPSGSKARLAAFLPCREAG